MIKKYLTYAAGVSVGALIVTILISQCPEADINPIKRTIRTLSEAPTETSHHNSTEPSSTTEPSHETSTDETEHQDHAHHISNGGLIIMFTFLVLFVGSVLKEIKKKTNIPYTPMILIMGLVCGYYHESWGILGKSIHLVNDIDPHTLLMVFIPALIFEGTYNTDAYVFHKSKWQVLIMAGPGVLITSFILAYSFVYLFGYSGKLSVSEALVIGSIISTTDPVAVVALLKELGASTRFKTILEGESLLNDGTAYVFFLVCLDIVVNGSFDLFPSLIKFFRLSFGGPLFGILVGFFASRWISRIMKDSTLIVMITVFSTYLVFFLSENYLEVSGILALVSMGVYLSGYTKVNLTHDNDHAVHTVWGFCGFSLETMIFMITGTFIGGKMVHYNDLALTTSDLWKAVLFYPFLTLVRYLVMLIQLPFLNKVGYKISGLSAVILTYGGLRGAIALSLGMLVAVDERLSIYLRHICLFYVVSTIAFTVCINGLTIKKVMKWTNFLKKDPIKEKVKYNMTRQILVNTMKEMSELKAEAELNGAHWNKVNELTRMKNYKILEELHADYTPDQNHTEFEGEDTGRKIFENGDNHNGLFSNRKGKNPPNYKDEESHDRIRSTLQELRTKNVRNRFDDEDIASSEDINNIIQDPFHNVRSDDVKRELRLRVYKLLKHKVQDKMDNRECTPDVVRSLKLLCDSCSDHPEKEVCLREYSDEFVGDHKTLKNFEKLSKIPLIGKIFLKILGDKIFFNYQFTATLITSAQEIAGEMKHIAHSLDYKKEVEEIKDEIVLNVTDLEGLKNALIHLFPGLINFIKTKMAAYRIVEYQRSQLNHFEHQGLISEKMSESWQEKLDKKIAMINKFKPRAADFFVEIKESAYFLLDYPLFSVLSEKDLKFVMDNRYLQTFEAGVTINNRGEKCLFIYLVNSGILKEHYTKSKDYRKTRGGIASISNICSPSGENLSTLNTISTSKLYRIRIDVIKELMRRDKRFEEQCYKVSFPGYVRFLESKSIKLRSLLSSLQDKRLTEIGQTSFIRKLKNKEKISLPKGGFLISGCISKTVYDKKTKARSRLTYNNLTFLLPNEGEYTCRKDSILLEFTLNVMKISQHITVPPQSPERSLIDHSSAGLNLINIVENDEKLDRIYTMEPLKKENGVNFEAQLPKRPNTAELESFLSSDFVSKIEILKRTKDGKSLDNKELRIIDNREVEFVDELSSFDEDEEEDWGRRAQIQELDDDVSSSEDKRGQDNVFGLKLKEIKE